MADKEVVSYDQICNAINDYYYPTETVNYRGTEIKVRKSLDAPEAMSFVDAVVRSCTGDGVFKYSPEVYAVAIRTFVFEFYTNIVVPEDNVQQYHMAYLPGLYDAVFSVIDKAQYEDLIESINKKISYTINMNIHVERTGIDKFLTQIETYIDSFEEATKGLSPEELKNVLGYIKSDEAAAGYAKSHMIK